MNHLNILLPPPAESAYSIISNLRAFTNRAAQLAIQMRTQRAEYVMRCAPRPEYDDHGDVCNTIFFSASEMVAINVDVSAEELEAEHATVRMVIFPLVIRRGNEYGEDYNSQETVYKMRVIVARGNRGSRPSSRNSVRSGSSVTWSGPPQKPVGRMSPIADHSPPMTPSHARQQEKAGGSGDEPTLESITRRPTIRMVPKDEDATMQEADDNDDDGDFPSERWREDTGMRYKQAGEKRRRNA